MNQAADVPENRRSAPARQDMAADTTFLEPAPWRRPASSATGFCRPVQKVPSFYFGCPAEEGGAGKAFLTRSGCFHGLDFALAWHPGSKTGLIKEALANIRVIFDFTGKSAHAAAHPELGRSALDACELMNVGVNYLREHVKVMPACTTLI